jgi:hypothetical protein
VGWILEYLAVWFLDKIIFKWTKTLFVIGEVLALRFLRAVGVEGGSYGNEILRRLDYIWEGNEGDFAN